MLDVLALITLNPPETYSRKFPIKTGYIANLEANGRISGAPLVLFDCESLSAGESGRAKLTFYAPEHSGTPIVSGARFDFLDAVTKIGVANILEVLQEWHPEKRQR